MPTYEYSCKKCGHTFETFQSMKDAPLQVCPEDKCAQQPWARGEIKRLLGTGAGLIFKGSGFYITDYRSDSYQQAAKKESGGGDNAKPSGGDGSGAKTGGEGSSGAGSGGSSGAAKPAGGTSSSSSSTTSSSES